MSVKEMDLFCLGFTLRIYGIKIMNEDYTKILLQIKGTLENIDESIYTLANDINRLTTLILKENQKDDEQRIRKVDRRK